MLLLVMVLLLLLSSMLLGRTAAVDADVVGANVEATVDARI